MWKVEGGGKHGSSRPGSQPRYVVSRNFPPARFAQIASSPGLRCRRYCGAVTICIGSSSIMRRCSFHAARLLLIPKTRRRMQVLTFLCGFFAHNQRFVPAVAAYCMSNQQKFESMLDMHAVHMSFSSFTLRHVEYNGRLSRVSHFFVHWNSGVLPRPWRSNPLALLLPSRKPMQVSMTNLEK